jgi:hypothetical protein
MPGNASPVWSGWSWFGPEKSMIGQNWSTFLQRVIQNWRTRKNWWFFCKIKTHSSRELYWINKHREINRRGNQIYNLNEKSDGHCEWWVVDVWDDGMEHRQEIERWVVGVGQRWGVIQQLRDFVWNFVFNSEWWVVLWCFPFYSMYCFMLKCYMSIRCIKNGVLQVDLIVGVLWF